LDIVTRTLLAQESVGHLNKNARAVTGIDLCPRSAAVLKIAQNGERALYRGVRFAPLDVHHETNATGVVFKAGVVEALCGPSQLRKTCFRGRHIWYLSSKGL
jgi:hypothetical protein